MNETELHRLANEATFLHERLAGRWVADDSPANRQAAQTRLERWCQLAAGGDWQRFAQRLAWDGLDADSALPLLCDGHLADREALPAWTEILAEVGNNQPDEQSAQADAPAFMQPFVSAAWARLTRAAGDDLAWLSPSARDSLTRYLTDLLTAQVKPARDYETESRQSDLWALCRTYPVLARQLSTTAAQWVDGASEFLRRLAADWPALAAHTGASLPLAPGCVVDLRPGLSDPHRGGRTVWRVDLVGGVTIAYKPKDLTLDRAWNKLLGWCNARGLTPPLARLWTLPQAGYGWMEWVERGEPPDLPLFYRRVGLLLGLLHLLHTSDAHGENLIFQGAHPLLIDAEMLVYPQVVGEEADDPLDVLRTGLLPRWVVNEKGVAEIGGLSGETDGASDYREEIVTGYQTLCRFVEAHWAALSAEDGPLSSLRQGEVRFAPRPTAAYLRLLEHLRHPAFLRRGIDFSIEADRLARTYSSDRQKGRFRHLLAGEHRALSQGDLPIFSAAVGQPALPNGESCGADQLNWPPFAPPTPAAQEQQSCTIRESLHRSAYLALPTERADSFLTQAIRLGEVLAARAVPLPGGGAGWIAVQLQPKSGLHQHGLIGDDLYAGRAGIALFLAGLYRVTGEERWRTLALSALRQERRLPDGGGQFYALTRISHLLAAPELLTAALLPVEEPSAWGVLDGQAGLLLGLLALYEQTANAALMERAVAWGDRLLAGADGWQHSTAGLGGFSHGAAGIAYALTRLYAASRDERFLDGARQGWAFQHSLYNEQAGNWQDRRGQEPVYLDNWCNGGAGIGLAAAGSLAVLPELAEVVERAGALLMTADRPFLDTLCCGGFGQIDSLLEMGLRLGHSAWIEQAMAQARQALTQATDAGHFALYDDLPAHLFNPAFFRGVAGIGYTLLRLAAVNGETEERLPCVLNWSVIDQ